MSHVTYRKSPIALAVTAALFAAIPLAHAAAEPQLDSIVVTGDRPATAPYEAPSQGSLDAGEPQSLINQHFIENNLTTTANYTDIVNIAPSVSDFSTNGRGNSESLNTTIRGFQDGQFNVTFDGIPWNDSNDFTHHSTSYFTGNTIGKVLVDRGPGTAAQIGNATFGGTIANFSKDPTTNQNVSASMTLGSWRTQDLAVQVDTGTMAQAGNGRALVSLTSINSDGFLTNNSLNRKNAFVKYVQPIDADTSITAVAMYNTIYQHMSPGGEGATLAQIAQFGPNFSMLANPGSDNNYALNFDDIHCDFEYLQLKTKVAGIRVDNKAYTYAYYHKISNTNDLSLTLGSKGTYDGLPKSDPTFNDVAGTKGYNNYRSVGDILRLEQDIGPGTLRGGFWFDYQWNDRYLTDVDFTKGGILDTSGDFNGFQRDLHDGLTTIDPFVEYEFRPIDDLTLTPGARYSSFGRKIDATVNPTSGTATSSNDTWNALQPSLYSLYHLSPNASVYAQYARGFLAPKDKLAYQPVQTAAKAIDPQHTTNLQAGGTWKTDSLTVSGDVYHIKFDNFFTYANKGANVVATGGGSAIFKGVELEGTYVVGGGFNIYANWTKNTQTYADGTKVQWAPDGTYTGGLIFDKYGLYGSLLAKHIGNTLQAGNNGPDGGNYDISGFTVTDLNLGYTFKEPTAGFKNIKLKLNVGNLFNKQQIYVVGGPTLSGVDTFYSLPGRSYMVTTTANF